MENVGKKLKELRIARKLRQYEVAQAVGVSRAMISNLEAGRRSLTDIAVALDVTKGKVDSWFSGNLNRVYFSKEFASYWYKIKTVLNIDTDKYDKIITEYHITRDNEHLVCPTLKCTNVASPLARVENAIINALEEYLEDYCFFVENYADEIKKEEKKNIDIVEMINKKIDRLKKEKRNALRNYNAEDITREEYLELKADIENELIELEEELEKIQSSEENDKLTRYQKAIPILSECLKEYHNLNVADKNELLRAIVEKAVYSKSEQSRWKRNNDFEIELFLRI